MRVTIVAGLVVGVSLAIQMAHRAQAKVGQAASAVSVHLSAIAMNAGRSGSTRDTFAGRLQDEEESSLKRIDVKELTGYVRRTLKIVNAIPNLTMSRLAL